MGWAVGNSRRGDTHGDALREAEAVNVASKEVGVGEEGIQGLVMKGPFVRPWRHMPMPRKEIDVLL